MRPLPALSGCGWYCVEHQLRDIRLTNSSISEKNGRNTEFPSFPLSPASTYFRSTHTHTFLIASTRSRRYKPGQEAYVPPQFHDRNFYCRQNIKHKNMPRRAGESCHGRAHRQKRPEVKKSKSSILIEVIKRTPTTAARPAHVPSEQPPEGLTAWRRGARRQGGGRRGAGRRRVVATNSLIRHHRKSQMSNTYVYFCTEIRGNQRGKKIKSEPC